MNTERPDDALLAMQGLENAEWTGQGIAGLAYRTNDRVRAIADLEMDLALSPADFMIVLDASARRAEADADSRS